MCARATLSKKTLREVAEELEAEFSEEDALTFRPRYNAAPSGTLRILRLAALWASYAIDWVPSCAL